MPPPGKPKGFARPGNPAPFFKGKSQRYQPVPALLQGQKKRKFHQAAPPKRVAPAVTKAASPADGGQPREKSFYEKVFAGEIDIEAFQREDDVDDIRVPKRQRTEDEDGEGRAVGRQRRVEEHLRRVEQGLSSDSEADDDDDEEDDEDEDGSDDGPDAQESAESDGGDESGDGEDDESEDADGASDDDDDDDEMDSDDSAADEAPRGSAPTDAKASQLGAKPQQQRQQQQQQQQQQHRNQAADGAARTRPADAKAAQSQPGGKPQQQRREDNQQKQQQKNQQPQTATPRSTPKASSGSAKPPAAAASAGGKSICKFFFKGKCKKGTACPFSHERPPNFKELQRVGFREDKLPPPEVAASDKQQQKKKKAKPAPDEEVAAPVHLAFRDDGSAERVDDESAASAVKPKPFSKAQAAFQQRQEEIAAARQAKFERQKQLKKDERRRQQQRGKMQQRTPKGQPVMRNMIGKMLGKLEKS